jgi:hypothetical protein
MDGEKPTKAPTERQLAWTKALKNTKARINADGKQWNSKKAPAIAVMFRNGAPAANIAAAIAELEDKAVKEEKKAVKAAAASAAAAKAGNSVKAAEKAAEAAGNMASAGVLAAAIKAGKTVKVRTAAQLAANKAKSITAKKAANMMKASGKEWSPKSFAKVVKAVKDGNNAAAQAIINTMANKAVAAAAAVANAAPANGASKANAWKAVIARASEQLKRNRGEAANQYKYRLILGSALRKGNNASIADAMSRINANLGARTAKKAVKAGNKTKKNVAAAPAAPGYNPFNNNPFANNVGPNAGPKGPNPFGNNAAPNAAPNAALKGPNPFNEF